MRKKLLKDPVERLGLSKRVETLTSSAQGSKIRDRLAVFVKVQTH